MQQEALRQQQAERQQKAQAGPESRVRGAFGVDRSGAPGVSFFAFCLDVMTLTFCQLMGFPY